MSKLVQIRAVPEQVHRTLKSRAAQAGTSLSEYLRAELELIAARPSADELRSRLASRSEAAVDERPATTIRRLRDHGE